MTCAVLSPTPTLRFYGTDGNPLAGGKLFTYDSVTSELRSTWKDAGMTAENPSQLDLNANGEPSVSGVPVSIFLENGRLYKYRWFDKHGTQIGEVDGISSTMLVGRSPIIVYPETREISIIPNSIGRDLLKNWHRFVPDSKYLQFKDFNGTVVITLSNALQNWLETEGYDG